MGIEDPDTDVVEQQQSAGLAEEGSDPQADPGGLPLEADPADVAEQHEVVPEDDDEMRER
jgi:hypothetical protein